MDFLNQGLFCTFLAKVKPDTDYQRRLTSSHIKPLCTFHPMIKRAPRVWWLLLFQSPFPKGKRGLNSSAHTKGAALTKRSLNSGSPGSRQLKSRFLLLFCFSITTTTTPFAIGWGPSKDLSWEKTDKAPRQSLADGFGIFQVEATALLDQGTVWLRGRLTPLHTASEGLAPRSGLTQDKPINFIRKPRICNIETSSNKISQEKVSFFGSPS